MDLSNAVEEIQKTKCEIEVLDNSLANDIDDSFRSPTGIINGGYIKNGVEVGAPH